MKVENNKELVNHPNHYGGESNPYEVVKIAEATGLDKDAYLFNVLKYIVRSGKKDNNPPLQDLKKALWYLDRRIKTIEENERLLEKYRQIYE
jgi:hypothetical protein